MGEAVATEQALPIDYKSVHHVDTPSAPSAPESGHISATDNDNVSLPDQHQPQQASKSEQGQEISVYAPSLALTPAPTIPFLSSPSPPTTTTVTNSPEHHPFPFPYQHINLPDADASALRLFVYVPHHPPPHRRHTIHCEVGISLPSPLRTPSFPSYPWPEYMTKNSNPDTQT